MSLTVIAALANEGEAQTTTSKTTTSIWVTTTDSAGNTAVIQAPYTQEFMSIYSEPNEDEIRSGGIGLGSSAQGTVGGIRSYDRVTISQPNEAHKIYSGVLGVLFVLVGLL